MALILKEAARLADAVQHKVYSTQHQYKQLQQVNPFNVALSVWELIPGKVDYRKID